MNASNAKQVAVALLVMIGAVSLAPGSQAQTFTPRAGYSQVSIEFAYNTKAPAAKIYRDLHKAARDACNHKGDRLLVMRQADRACVAEMVESGVSQLGRADIAELHQGRITVASR